jgi:hypothetical protein
MEVAEEPAVSLTHPEPLLIMVAMVHSQRDSGLVAAEGAAAEEMQQNLVFCRGKEEPLGKEVRERETVIMEATRRTLLVPAVEVPSCWLPRTV